jgi:hypothetical protein
MLQVQRVLFSAAAPTARPIGCHHIQIPRRPSSERTGRLLLLALATDRADGHPDNVRATAKLLGVSGEIVRRWRRSLVADGILLHADGMLRPGPGLAAWQEMAAADFECRGLRWGWDPVARGYLRAGPDRVHAGAVVYGDAVGWRRESRWCRPDAERAALAGVSIHTVRAARRDLVRGAWVLLEPVRRGRCSLLRVAPPPEGLRPGRALGAATARIQAASAAAGRQGGVPTGCRVGVPTGCRPSHSTLRVPSPPMAPRPPLAPTGMGPEPVLRSDGTGEQPRIAQVARSAVQATETRTPAAIVEPAATLRAWVRDCGAGWLAQAARFPARSVGDLLARASYCDRAPVARRRAADSLMRRWGRDAPALVLAVLVDVLGGRCQSVGAVLAHRLHRLIAGRPDDALSPPNRGRAAMLLARALG